MPGIKEQRQAKNLMHKRDCLRECHSSLHDRNNAKSPLHCNTLSAIISKSSMGLLVVNSSVWWLMQDPRNHWMLIDVFKKPLIALEVYNSIGRLPTIIVRRMSKDP